MEATRWKKWSERKEYTRKAPFLLLLIGTAAGQFKQTGSSPLVQLVGVG